MSDELLRLDGVVYDASRGPDEGEGPDGFPAFTVKGVFLRTGQEFERSVALELDGRDADETHITGFNFDDLWERPELGVEQTDVQEELYNKIYASEAYQKCAGDFHDTGGM